MTQLSGFYVCANVSISLMRIPKVPDNWQPPHAFRVDFRWLALRSIMWYERAHQNVAKRTESETLFDQLIRNLTF